MSHESPNVPDSELLAREQFWQRTIAFAVTVCCTFVVLILLWPISVRGFSSNTQLLVEVGDSAHAQQYSHDLLLETIRQQLSSRQLSQLVERVRNKSGLFNDSLAELDLDMIRQSLTVKISPTETPDRLRLDFAFRGNGTPDEKTIVRLLADDLTNSLINSTKQLTSGMSHVEVSNSSQIKRELDLLEDLVGEIESDLLGVRQSVSELLNQDVSPFHNAAHSSAPEPSLDDINQTISSMDFSAVRIALDELKASSAQSSSWMDGKKLPVPYRIKTQPIGGVPTLTELMWISIVAIAFASVIAINYRPFDTRGFQNVSQVASILKIPVLTALPKKRGNAAFANDGSQTQATHWANQVVVVARLLLFGLIVSTIGFCLVNEGVRTAFLENPIHGFARIFWMFSGN